MKGEIRLKIRSRALDKNLVEDIVFDLENVRAMNRQILAASKRSEQETGRRGCTTEELYDIIQSYFNYQIQQLVKTTAADLAFSALNRKDGRTVNDAKKFISGARDIAMKYAHDVGDKADEHVGSLGMGLGIGKADLDLAKDLFKSSAANLFAKLDKPDESGHDDEEYSNEYVLETDDDERY